MENIKDKMNIVDEIKRNKINGTVPIGAEYASLNPDGTVIEKFYAIKNVKFNDGTNKDVLEYKSEQGVWTPSNFNSDYKNELKDKKFLKIVD